MSIHGRKSSPPPLAAVPGQLSRLFMELLRSRGGQEWFARALLTDERLFATALKLAAGDDPGQPALPAVDAKIVAFINAMTPDERISYVKTGDLPQAVFSRVNAKLADAT